MTRVSFFGVASFLGLAALLSGFRPLYLILFTFIAGRLPRTFGPNSKAQGFG